MTIYYGSPERSNNFRFYFEKKKSNKWFVYKQTLFINKPLFTNIELDFSSNALGFRNIWILCVLSTLKRKQVIT